MPPESLKRQADDYEAEQQVQKLQRLDLPDPSASQSQARKKKANAAVAAPASRTGQACDRCKTRKIRCDDTHGGCMPCRQNNTECKTTDRVTQRATVRGYTEAIERDNSTLRQQLIELEQQVRELGAEPKTAGRFAPVREPYNVAWPAHVAGSGQGWDVAGRTSTAYDSPLDTRAGQETNIFAIPTQSKANESDGWFGISTANSLISPMKGTSLSLFGMRIDISDFVAEGPEDASPTSYSFLLKLMLSHDKGRTPEMLLKAKLPDNYTEAASYTKWYLSSLNPWLPILHKPQMMGLVYRWYHEPNFQPTPAEQVMMHMVHAAMKFNICIRNMENCPEHTELLEQAYAHYHYAIGFIPILVVSSTLPDMQAMAVITAQVRNFAQPSTAWILCVWSMALAIELGLHRSPRVWAAEDSKKNTLENEIGKRVFYSLLLIHVTLSGRLGRPMPLRLEDFDIELPEPTNDNVLPENLAPSAPQCSWELVIDFFKLTVLYLETYNHIYAVRPSGDYAKNVMALEAKLERWRDELHPSLTEASLADQGAESRVFALWIHLWEAEYRMLLHHPSLNRTSSQEFASQNLDICMHSASKYIELQQQLHQLKCLDGTWGNAVTYIAAIFTLLFAYWERRDQITSADLAKLHVEMEQSLIVIGDVGVMLGSRQRLKEAIRPIIDGGLAQIDRFMVEKTASAAVARAGLQASTSGSHNRKDHSHTEAQDLSASLQINNMGPSLKNTGYATDGAMMRPHSAYQPAMSTVYADDGVDPTAQFYSAFDPATNAYQTVDARLTAHNQAHDHPEVYMFSQQHSFPPQHISSGVMAWRQWTDTLKDHIEPSDYINHSANALMALTGRDMAQAEDGQSATLLRDMTTAVNMNQSFLIPGAVNSQQWPMNAYPSKDEKYP